MAAPVFTAVIALGIAAAFMLVCELESNGLRRRVRAELKRTKATAFQLHVEGQVPHVTS